MNFNFKDRYDINDLLLIMKILRGENGCPWDREQTHQSIRKNFIEETYEVVEAIDNNDMTLLREELGDVLLQVVFHACMEEENNVFNFDDVANDICHKLIIRHPHVFSDIRVDNAAQVLDNWNTIKQKQKGQETVTETLQSVPRQLPALMRATKIQTRAKKAGMDFSSISQALESLKSEIIELENALNGQDEENIQEEIGDVLFSCVNIARLNNQDAEELLSRSSDKFISRFAKVEQRASDNSIDMKSIDEEALNQMWIKAKE